jgi:hypothetical protein
MHTLATTSLQKSDLLKSDVECVLSDKFSFLYSGEWWRYSGSVLQSVWCRHQTVRERERLTESARGLKLNTWRTVFLYIL